MRDLIGVAIGLALLATPTVATAKACRDAKGKFTACEKAQPAAAARCRDSKGHFAKCGTPGAKPA